LEFGRFGFSDGMGNYEWNEFANVIRIRAIVKAEERKEKTI